MEEVAVNGENDEINLESAEENTQAPHSGASSTKNEETHSGTQKGDVFYDQFPWIKRLGDILRTFQNKPPHPSLVTKIQAELSYTFEPALQDVAFTAFSAKAGLELANTILAYGSRNNFIFWSDIFEPYALYESRFEVARIFLYVYVSKAIEANNILVNVPYFQCSLCMLDENTYPLFIKDLAGTVEKNVQDKAISGILDQFAKETRNFMRFKASFCRDIMAKWTRNYCHFKDVAKNMWSSFDARMKCFMQFKGYEITFREGVAFEVDSLQGTPELERLKKEWKDFKKYCYKNEFIQ
jgi:hypothetical protein